MNLRSFHMCTHHLYIFSVPFYALHFFSIFIILWKLKIYRWSGFWSLAYRALSVCLSNLSDMNLRPRSGIQELPHYLIFFKYNYMHLSQHLVRDEELKVSHHWGSSKLSWMWEDLLIQSNIFGQSLGLCSPGGYDSYTIIQVLTLLWFSAGLGYEIFFFSEIGRLSFYFLVFLMYY